VFVPILIATYCSTMCGCCHAAVQRLNLWKPRVMGWLALLTVSWAAWSHTSRRLDADAVGKQSALLANGCCSASS